MSASNLIDNQALETSMSSAHKLLHFMTNASSQIKTILDDQQTKGKQSQFDRNLFDLNKSDLHRELPTINNLYRQNNTLNVGRTFVDFYPTPPTTPSSNSSSPLNITVIEEDPFSPIFTQKFSPEKNRFSQEDSRSYFSNTQRYSPDTKRFSQQDRSYHHSSCSYSPDTCRFSQQDINLYSPDMSRLSRKRASYSLSCQEPLFKYNKSDIKNNNTCTSYLIPCQDKNVLSRHVNHYITTTNPRCNPSSISSSKDINRKSLTTVPSFEIDDISDTLVLKEIIPITELRKYLI